MKKILSIVFFGLLCGLGAYSQYFQGSFTNPATTNQLVFKMKPTANLTTAISLMEFAFRYPTSSTPIFSVSSIVSNTTNFPGLDVQRFLPDYVDGGYTYVKFIHNTGTIPSATYLSGIEKDIFTITLLSSTAPSLPMIEMASEPVADNFAFGVVNGAGVFIDPGTGSQLYGLGYNTIGVIHLLPLVNVPLPVKFLGFNVTKKNNDAILNWQIENETSLTDRYELERSLNGVDFKKVNTVAPKNNGNSSNSYDFTDMNLSAVRSAGIFYYRVKQIDKDGNFIYSATKSVRLNSKGIVIGVYPNPLRDLANITIDLEQDSDATITINDANGKQVQNIQAQLFKGPNIKKISMQAFAAGSYLLKVQTPTEMKTLSVVKIN